MSAAASKKIDALIASIEDWRSKTFAAVRKAFLDADKEIVEEWKWRGTPVWEKDGLIAVAGAFKGKVKVTFHKGAHLRDPGKVFNNGLDGNQWRAIDYLEGDKVDAAALKTLVREAVAYNAAQKTKKAPAKKKAKAAKPQKA
jgi:hypothetical protein